MQDPAPTDPNTVSIDQKAMFHLLYRYEVFGSWWAGLLPFGHAAASRYFAWKVERKQRAFVRFTEAFQRKEDKV